MDHAFEDVAVKVNAPELLEEALRRKRRLQRIAELHIQLADGGGFEIPVDFGDVARFHFSSETFPVAVST